MIWPIFELCNRHSGFAKKRVQWLIEHSTSYQNLCWVDSLVSRNPLLRKAAKRYRQAYMTALLITKSINHNEDK
jgi:hypothetical protein